MLNETLNLYRTVSGSIPGEFTILLKVFLLSLGVVAYGIIIWITYQMLAKKDIIGLNLAKYNNSEDATLKKIFASMWYIIEFIVIYPLLIIVWFFIFSMLLLVLAKDHTLNNVLVISTMIIMSTRICAYYNEDLAKDLAKMFPFILLGVAVLTPGFFDISQIISRVNQIPELLSMVGFYLVSIIIIEVILRFIALPKIVTGED